MAGEPFWRGAPGCRGVGSSFLFSATVQCRVQSSGGGLVRPNDYPGICTPTRRRSVLWPVFLSFFFRTPPPKAPMDDRPNFGCARPSTNPREAALVELGNSPRLGSVCSSLLT